LGEEFPVTPDTDKNETSPSIAAVSTKPVLLIWHKLCSF